MRTGGSTTSRPSAVSAVRGAATSWCSSVAGRPCFRATASAAARASHPPSSSAALLEADAKRDARQSLRETWDVVKESRFAESFGVAGAPVPDHVDKAAERLVEMRSVADRRGHNMDKRDRDDVGRTTRKAGEYRGYAASHRAQAADARTEKALRATIAGKFPQLYDREATGRRAFQQT
ncbi:hypothetical protein ACFRI7_03210 [Streptomyces sp. NPDC056716]|uniref:hypothetical protein n=1 Tax=unclassified Streptomyces TaxID=2593676 RepID=UPI0036D177F7